MSGNLQGKDGIVFDQSKLLELLRSRTENINDNGDWKSMIKKSRDALEASKTDTEQSKQEKDSKSGSGMPDSANLFSNNEAPPVVHSAAHSLMKEFLIAGEARLKYDSQQVSKLQGSLPIEADYASSQAEQEVMGFKSFGPTPGQNGPDRGSDINQGSVFANNRPSFRIRRNSFRQSTGNQKKITNPKTALEKSINDVIDINIDLEKFTFQQFQAPILTTGG